MKVLVTGASGLLGANLVFELHRRGHAVTALYRHHPIQYPGVRAAACDLTDTACTAALVSGARPKWIIHCAAATDLEWCESHPRECMRINGEVPGELAAVAGEIGAGMVYISTDSVFDGVDGGYRENDSVSPVNRYSRGKAAGELAVAGKLERALVVRVNVYGWNLQSKNSLAEWALGLLQAGRETPGFRDVVFSPVLVNDLAESVLELIERGCTGIYHAGSPEAVSKYEFLRALAEVFELDESLVRESSIEASGLATPRPRRTWLRTAKIAAALGRSMPGVRNGLRKFRALAENGFVDRLKAAAA
jgi:dTDP-4-dehydrorhamnose reductase